MTRVSAQPTPLLSFSIRGLEALTAMVVLAMLVIAYVSVFDGYPWAERWVSLLWLACAPVPLRVATTLLRRRRRAGALIGVLCLLAGPTPMFLGEEIPALMLIWPFGLGIPLVIVWFQLRD